MKLAIAPLLLFQYSSFPSHQVIRHRNHKLLLSHFSMTDVKVESNSFLDIEDLVTRYSSNTMNYEVDSTTVSYLRSCLLKWYRINRRKLPWFVVVIIYRFNVYFGDIGEGIKII